MQYRGAGEVSGADKSMTKKQQPEHDNKKAKNISTIKGGGIVSSVYFKYIVAFSVGAVIALIVFITSGLFSADNDADAYKILSNGFFTAAVLVGGTGILVYCSSGGVFDMLSYGVRGSLNVLFRRTPKPGEPKDFYEYKVQRHKKQPKFLYMILTGLFYFIVSVVFTILFNKVA